MVTFALASLAASASAAMALCNWTGNLTSLLYKKKFQYTISVAKTTLEMQMSICPSVIKTPQPIRIVPIALCPMTVKPKNHIVDQPSGLFSRPLRLSACFPNIPRSYISTLSTLTPQGSVASSRMSSIHWAIFSLKISNCSYNTKTHFQSR